VFVSDILQIPIGYIQICTGCTAPYSTSLDAGCVFMLQNVNHTAIMAL